MVSAVTRFLLSFSPLANLCEMHALHSALFLFRVCVGRCSFWCPTGLCPWPNYLHY